MGGDGLEPKKRFSTAVMGYNKAEVEDFIESLQAENEEKIHRYRTLVKELEDANAKVLNELWRTKKHHDSFMSTLSRAVSGSKSSPDDEYEYNEVSLRALAEHLNRHREHIVTENGGSGSAGSGAPDTQAREMMHRIYGLISGNKEEDTTS
jgi:cell division septum initiation protein DivIVA